MKSVPNIRRKLQEFETCRFSHSLSNDIESFFHLSLTQQAAEQRSENIHKR